MTTIPELLTYTLVNILPLLVLALLPFRDSLRLPMRIVILLAALLYSVDAVISWLALNAMSAAALSVLSIFLYLGFYLAAVKAGPLKLLAVLLILMNFASLATITATFLITLLAPGLSSHIYSWEYCLLYALGLGLPFPFYYQILDKRIRPQVTAGNAEPFWKSLWAIPATFCAVNYQVLFSGGGVRAFSSSWKNVLFFWAVNAGSLLVTDMLARLLEEGRKNLHLQQMNSQLAIQAVQYEAMQKNMEELRRARHDLRQHLNMIQAYLDSGDGQALADYISAYGKSLPDFSPGKYCKNYAVDATLRYYAEQMEAAGIDVEVKVFLPEKLSVSEPDICVLLGNLLENAHNACTMQGVDTWVRIVIETAGECGIVIIVDNTSLTPPKVRDGEFLSAIHKGAGVGIPSIKNIAARYGGMADFKWDDGIFYASVLLNPQGGAS